MRVWGCATDLLWAYSSFASSLVTLKDSAGSKYGWISANISTSLTVFVSNSPVSKVDLDICHLSYSFQSAGTNKRPVISHCLSLLPRQHLQVPGREQNECDALVQASECCLSEQQTAGMKSHKHTRLPISLFIFTNESLFFFSFRRSSGTS